MKVLYKVNDLSYHYDMVNFTLDYLRLEHKEDKPHECEWCGDSFSGHKRKYCKVECRKEEYAYIKNKDSGNLEQEYYCEACGNLLQGQKRKYCGDVCKTEAIYDLYKNTRPDLRKSDDPDISYFDPKEYGQCNVDVQSSHNVMEHIDLGKPYTCESDHYITKCIVEELPLARNANGSAHQSKSFKPLSYYYGVGYQHAIMNDRKRQALLKLRLVLQEHVTKLEEA
tara:strand:+ start:7864 stop:8538 length:675 start_codon:yes stop_codon:yes gene_type:complete